MAQYGRQTTGKKAYKAPFKTYLVWKHHAAYRVYKGALWFYPIYENGSVDYHRGQLLMESPKAFQTGHRLALLQLGTPVQRHQKILRKITYY